MLLFQPEGAALFRATLEAAMRTPEGLGWWYLKAIDRLAREHPIGTVCVEGLQWGEVDYPADLEAARRMVAGWGSERSGSAKVRSAS
jgi:choline kinase